MSYFYRSLAIALAAFIIKVIIKWETKPPLPEEGKEIEEALAQRDYYDH